MKFHRALQERFGFTRSEIIVILFLSGALLLGLGVRWYRTLAGGAHPPPAAARTDFRGLDSEFAARSATIDSSFIPGPPGRSAINERAKKPSAGPVDLNSASADELMRLPGIGRHYADEIVRYRMVHGPFQSVDDITRVKGIGPKKLARLRPHAVVRVRAGQP